MGALRGKTGDMDDKDEARALLALLLTPGAGYTAGHRALAAARAEGLPLAELLARPPRETARLLPAGSDGLGFLLHEARSRLHDAAELLRKAARMGAKAAVAGAAPYPTALSEGLAAQAPPLLFYRGNPAHLGGAAAGIVGTRSPTEAGLAAARACAGIFGGVGRGIVSGGADGIDTEAHRAAVEGGGWTVVVLAQGILTYALPEYLRGAFEDGRAIVLSQFAPLSAWATHAAVTRNATIAALSRVVCVIEPRKAGGSMRTGRCALAIGRPVFVAGEDDALHGAELLRRAGAQPLLGRGGLAVEALQQAWRAAPRRPPQGSLFE
jgi:DNA protecting protein DprA